MIYVKYKISWVINLFDEVKQYISKNFYGKFEVLYVKCDVTTL